MKIATLLLCLVLLGCGKSNESLTNLDAILAAGNSACGKEGASYRHKERNMYSRTDGLVIDFICRSGVWEMDSFNFMTGNPKRADEMLAALRKKNTK